ncbi:TPR repeat-containing protein [Candidatus Magnetomorum sp. HK-1]|nr:TPR repeat-containing protein [Candidatus Magnetomorum sp. HK-1]
MIRKKPFGLQKKHSAINIQFREKCPVKMGLPDNQTSKYLSGSKPHEFIFGTLSGQIYEIDHSRVLVFDDVVEMAEMKPQQKYSENEILAYYGQPLRAIKTYCETKVMIYQNFAVDIVEEMIHQVVYFEINVQ